jgi:hypothetical protein
MTNSTTTLTDVQEDALRTVRNLPQITITSPSKLSASASSQHPPDPEQMNDRRSEWAEASIASFIQATGTDREDALPDLLADLMHWADRNDCDFEAALERARMHYEAETAAEGV